MFRIGIDARFLGPEGTGIGRYVEKLLENLEELDGQNEYFVFLRKNNFPLYNPKNKNFIKITADAHWYSVKEQTLLPAVLNKLKLDLVHFPHFNIPLLYQGKFVVTIHDLTKSKFGQKASGKKLKPVYWTKHQVYNFTLHQALNRAEKIIVPSEFVKKEILNMDKINPEKIEVTYEAADTFVDSNFSPSEGKVKEIYNKFSIREPFILYVGNTYDYKNVDIIVEALLKIDQSIKFVCVSARNPSTEKLIRKTESLGVRDRLILTDYLSDDDLQILYSKALCFVFPSLSEGFGLPGLEAMAALCPVVAAKSSSLPEIYGEAAIYFDPKSVNSLATEVTSLFKNSTQRAKMKSLGLKKVQQYYWKETDTKTLKIYNESIS